MWCKVFDSGRDRRNASPCGLVAGLLIERNKSPPQFCRLPSIVQSARFSLLKALAIATILFCGSWGSGHAAAFCLQIYGQPLQCIFVDSRECYREAIRQQGELHLQPSGGVTSEICDSALLHGLYRADF